MKRGEMYLVKKPGSRDPKKQRVFVIVSRQLVIDSRFSSLICAPVYSQYDGLRTQVAVGQEVGLKKDSSIHCDELMSLPKVMLTHYVGALPRKKSIEMNRALRAALELEDDDFAM